MNEIKEGGSRDRSGGGEAGFGWEDDERLGEVGCRVSMGARGL
jgi:hypothetical protein